MDNTRQSFLRDVSQIYELVATAETQDKKEEITQKLAEMNKKYQRIQSKITEYKRFITEKKQYFARKKEFKKKVKVLLKVKQEVGNMKKMNEESDLLDFKNQLDVSSAEILLYASKISNFLQAAPGYSTKENQLFPWSFGMNKVEALEMESSGLYYMYKNNSHYDVLSPPEVVYVNRSEKNIMNFTQVGEFKFELAVRGHLYLRPQVHPGESFIYTIDGSIPNKFSLKAPQSDLIYISQECVLKIRSFKPGSIDSPIIEYCVKVMDTAEAGGDMGGFENMVRPGGNMMNHDDQEEEGSVNEDFEDLFSGARFTSIHDPGIFSTPNMMDSSLNTPIN